MSRIGRKPIEIPESVTVEQTGSEISVQGPNGALSVKLLPNLKVALKERTLEVSKQVETPETQRSYGLMRTLLANMVAGVSQGFERRLEINGVGYRANVAGSTVNLSLGFSHPIAYELPEGVSARVEKNVIIIAGFDKALVGQVAANIRAFKKPEPYKGKGIKYVEERIRRKAGKAATKG
jgi:large subunit ribosomal protein L6